MYSYLESYLEKSSIVITPNQRLARHIKQFYVKKFYSSNREITNSLPEILSYADFLSFLWNHVATDFIELLLNSCQVEIIWKKNYLSVK